MPDRVGRCQAGWRAKLERAERDFSMVSREHTDVPVLRHTARHPPPAAPISPIPAHWVSGIPPGSPWWKAAVLPVSEFCLLYWAGLAFIYLRSLETLAAGRAAAAPAPRTVRGVNISHFQAGSILSPNPPGSSIVGSPLVPGGSETPVGPIAEQALGHPSSFLWVCRFPGAGVEVLSLPCTPPAALSQRGATSTPPRQHRDCPQRPVTAPPPPACVSGGFNCSGVS